MKRQWIAAIALMVCIQNHGLGQEIDWHDDLDSAKTLAAEQDKLVLLHFSADWCRPCQNLETFVFTSPKVISAFQQRVIAVHVDTDTHPELVKQYNVTEIPTDVVVSTAGRILQKRQSPKDTSNYVRMINSLDAVSEALSEDRAALAQKIDHVLDNGKTAEIVSPESNDFVADQTEHKQPGPARDSARLLSDFESRANLVDHQAEGRLTSLNEPGQQGDTTDSNLARKSSAPQRVINDQFFVEKSTAADFNATPDSGRDGSAADLQSRASLKTAADDNVVTGTLSPAVNRNQSNALKPVATDRVASAKIVSVDAAPIAQPQRPETAETDAPPVQQTAASDAIMQSQPTSSDSFGLGGKCPVTLIQDGKWIAGDEQFGCVHRGRTYLFADQPKLVQFQRDPDLYSPILAGYDPVIFHEQGELVEGREQHGVFMGRAPNQRIVLFQTEATRAQFQENPRQYMETTRQAISQSDSLK